MADHASIAASLTAWFRRAGRDYPWRRTRDPYAILVSEVMLQQTQIATVLDRGYYSRWLARFPDFQSLAAAPEADVLRAWEGLGYYRRARNLHRLAQVIVADYGGCFPAEPEEIRALPGIGPYTAGAIASFAFGLKEPIVDGNVARVLARLANDATPIDSTEGKQGLWKRAAELVEAAPDARQFNSALMELGQTICRVQRPLCTDCPVRTYCQAADPAALPIKGMRTAITPVTERVFFHRTAAGVLLEQETGSRRTGLWKLPALPPSEHHHPPPVLMKTSYSITRYKVTLWVHAWQPKHAPGLHENHRFIAIDELANAAMPSPYRRTLNRLLETAERELSKPIHPAVPWGRACNAEKQ